MVVKKDKTKRDLKSLEKKQAERLGDLFYELIQIGHHVAKREGYVTHRGLDALYFYLIEKYHWPPSLVRGLNHEELLFLFDEYPKDRP